MTSPTAESIANARLDERRRCADRADELADETEAQAERVGVVLAEERKCLRRLARALRDFAAELRRL